MHVAGLPRKHSEGSNLPGTPARLGQGPRACVQQGDLRHLYQGFICEINAIQIKASRPRDQSQINENQKLEKLWETQI